MFKKYRLWKNNFRDRKRNFATARSGFIGVCVLMLGSVIFHLIYNLESWTFESYSLDSGTKAFLISVCADILDCVVNPCVLLSGAPTVRQAVHKWKIWKICENLKNLLNMRRRTDGKCQSDWSHFDWEKIESWWLETTSYIYRILFVDVSSKEIKEYLCKLKPILWIWTKFCEFEIYFQQNSFSTFILLKYICSIKHYQNFKTFMCWFL